MKYRVTIKATITKDVIVEAETEGDPPEWVSVVVGIPSREMTRIQ